MKRRFSFLLSSVILACMLTACGYGQDQSFPETIPQSGADYRNPEETGGAATNQPISLEDPEGESEDIWEPTPEPEPTPTPEPQEIQITISAAGDVSLGNYYGQDYSGSFRQTYKKVQDYSYFFENVYDIFSVDDMTIVNLEGMLTLAEERREEKRFCISGDPDFVNILTAGSVEAVSMGNNHRLDYYQQGTDDTVEVLDEVGIPYAYDQYTGTYETFQGILIGFASVCFTANAPYSERYLQEGITGLREAGCDLVLACCHRGRERV